MCDCLLYEGGASQHLALASARVLYRALPSLESVLHQVSIEAVRGATEVPARRPQQRVMDAHEAIGVDFDAQDRRQVAASRQATMPRVGRQDNRPLPHALVPHGS